MFVNLFFKLGTPSTRVAVFSTPNLRRVWTAFETSDPKQYHPRHRTYFGFIWIPLSLNYFWAIIFFASAIILLQHDTLMGRILMQQEIETNGDTFPQSSDTSAAQAGAFSSRVSLDFLWYFIASFIILLMRSYCLFLQTFSFALCISVSNKPN